MCAPLHVDIVVSCLLYRRIPTFEQPESWLKKTSVFQLIIEVSLVEVVRVPLSIYGVYIYIYIYMYMIYKYIYIYR